MTDASEIMCTLNPTSDVISFHTYLVRYAGLYSARAALLLSILEYADVGDFDSALATIHHVYRLSSKLYDITQQWPSHLLT